MELDLTANEIRVLFSLVEKEHTTPDQYPLSTNSLRLACNQKTSRDPVLDLTEPEVDAALLSLRERKLVRSLKPQGSRAWKHRHVIGEVITLDPAELAALTVLGLRGDQTSGEIRQRGERLHSFDSTDAVDAALARLASRPEPLVVNIGREPGQSQDRWRHLLGAVALSATAGRQRAMATLFGELHETGFFLLPNPWDRGSARMLQDLGAVALATTSAGLGRSIGKDDQQVTRDELVAHVDDLTSFVEVPVSVDSERLFPDASGGIARTVEMLVDAGAAGISIEDYDPTNNSIDPVERAAAAVAEAVAAAAASSVVVTARAENHLYGRDDLDDTIARLCAYRDAGAHCLYAPGVSNIDDIARLVREVAAPVNVLSATTNATMTELASVGVRRVSTGSALYNSAARAAQDQAAALFAALP